MKILVTGANGFVGSHVVTYFRKEGYEVVAATRRPCSEIPGLDAIVYQQGGEGDRILDDIEVVIHTAGVAHRSYRGGDELADEFTQGNFQVTKDLADAVAESGVKMLVHISSIAASGHTFSLPGKSIRESDQQEPASDYGKSKLRAEQPVLDLSSSGKAGINLRPPLIYGPGARGNWAKLVKLIDSPFPLPFASAHNRRSYVGIERLCDLLLVLLDHRERPDLSGTYHIAEPEPVSLPMIISALREVRGRNAGLFPCPVSLMRLALEKSGRGQLARGLFDDLIVDSQRFDATFCPKPGAATIEGMRKSFGSQE